MESNIENISQVTAIHNEKIYLSSGGIFSLAHPIPKSARNNQRPTETADVGFSRHSRGSPDITPVG
jgi:hypothetical protein